MLSLEERLRELEEPPGAELLDMDAVLRQVGYVVTVDRIHRVYHHQAWNSSWTFRNGSRLIPPAYAREVVSFIRLKLKREERTA
ncbi:MAG TPA: hypothetical protein VFJ16_01480 [Longimicrobium sp.]|nr:hypothetical protein [Longimicrobium sp.]